LQLDISTPTSSLIALSASKKKAARFISSQTDLMPISVNSNSARMLE
jgi:hypothetical protein